VDSPAPANGIAHAIKDEVALLRKLGSDLIGRVAPEHWKKPAVDSQMRRPNMDAQCR
jgi:hypothetical protein